jgi:hypothetical protein
MQNCCLFQAPSDAALYNALMIATKYGQSKAVTMLMAAGFDVNHTDPMVTDCDARLTVVPDLVDSYTLWCRTRTRR